MTTPVRPPLDEALLDRALSVALSAADAAAALIHEYFVGEFDVRQKSDQTPVTEADVEAERVIRKTLLGEFPEHAMLGEEEGHHGNSEYLWLVDPIDGTKAFVRGYPMFSTQIALMHRGELVLGVSCAAEFGETCWARRGGGAFFRNASGRDQPIKLAPLPPLAQRAVSTGNLKSLAAGPRWPQLAELIGQTGRIRGYGDFLHYHLLARGGIDAVIESDVNILDIAALAVIVSEAGGVLSDLDGNPPTLDTRSVLAASPAWHGELLEHFRGWRDE
jgi:histidinol-phosphatase